MVVGVVVVAIVVIVVVVVLDNAGFQISNSFFIGYAYDHSVTKLQKYNDGSHEIILKFNLNDKSSSF